MEGRVDLGNMNVCYLLMSNNERRLALVEKDNERRRANAAALKRIEEEYEKLLEWKAELLKAVQKTDVLEHMLANKKGVDMSQTMKDDMVALKEKYENVICEMVLAEKENIIMIADPTDQPFVRAMFNRVLERVESH